MLRLSSWLLAILCLFSSGCAFDVVSVNQVPTQFTATTDATRQFQLGSDVKAKLGTGFPTELHAGTRWTKTGTVPQGEVYRTTDQIVKVEASNIQEAWIVVSNDTLVGFYTPVEHTFAPLSHPNPLSLDRSHLNSSSP